MYIEIRYSNMWMFYFSIVIPGSILSALVFIPGKPSVNDDCKNTCGYVKVVAQGPAINTSEAPYFNYSSMLSCVVDLSRALFVLRKLAAE